MTTTAARPSDARDRLLRTAGELFYAEGINTVGVDRVVAEAKVTKATFYRHFPSKEDLVVAYLESVDEQFRQWFDQLAVEHPDPAERLRAFFEGIATYLCGPDFRGCHFINAGAEDARKDSRPRRAVARHREWFRTTVRETLREAGVDRADAVGDQLVALRDGAMVEGYLESPEFAGTVLMKGFDMTVGNPALLG
ncbi:TetR/AcrR family transcriptional regulator [Aeromicrobium chenweiae]|uniref:TetR family transcriptional regulator n=1 Tax=Aeromicrobium chenweiae TaxID=2079793 RepID=A0A2S0WHX7_9ACTN|nr:TetR/AcrR family transcriptional regulator [Aeromicrobium chenweiae]AWB90917.1 TetR family transcriptional regulator [Aeromicrobium chenweiae]TGN32136.1 TetR/AcrR family transcriptional regulator [Aeromicrobium chenweiae]